ncbi:MAG TPA: aldehyde dehydrogenase family protein, partial [Gemmatimonadaceae bacterium]|nr:aldehyde dehydrogenase family protein [Gemmatimonadaceae bacterium]
MSFHAVDPFRDESLGEWPALDAEAIQHTIAAAHAAQRTGRRWPLERRIDVIEELGRRLRVARDDLADRATREM